MALPAALYNTNPQIRFNASYDMVLAAFISGKSYLQSPSRIAALHEAGGELFRPLVSESASNFLKKIRWLLYLNDPALTYVDVYMLFKQAASLSLRADLPFLSVSEYTAFYLHLEAITENFLASRFLSNGPILPGNNFPQKPKSPQSKNSLSQRKPTR